MEIVLFRRPVQRERERENILDPCEQIGLGHGYLVFSHHSFYVKWQRHQLPTLLHEAHYPHSLFVAYPIENTTQQLLILPSSYSCYLVVTHTNQQLLILTSSYSYYLVVTHITQQLLIRHETLLYQKAHCQTKLLMVFHELSQCFGFFINLTTYHLD